MAVTITNRGLELLASNDAEALDIRQAIFTGTVPAAGTIRDWVDLADVEASTLAEATATNYARYDVADVTITNNGPTTDSVSWTGTGTTLNSVAAGETWTCVAWYQHVDGTNANDQLIAIDEPAATLVTNGGNVTTPNMSITITNT